MRWWQVAIQEGEQRNEKEGNEINKDTRPGRYSMINNKPKNSTDKPATKFGCTGCGNQAHPLGGFALPGVSTGSGVERAIISLECIPAESPTILECKWELSGLDWIQARATKTAEELLYRVTRESHKILLWHYNWVSTVPVTLHIDMQADATVITE